jgi:hypothetical protein
MPGGREVNLSFPGELLQTQMQRSVALPSVSCTLQHSSPILCLSIMEPVPTAVLDGPVRKEQGTRV